MVGKVDIYESARDCSDGDTRQHRHGFSMGGGGISTGSWIIGILGVRVERGHSYGATGLLVLLLDMS
jgi:hypothetical protein